MNHFHPSRSSRELARRLGAVGPLAIVVLGGGTSGAASLLLLAAVVIMTLPELIAEVGRRLDVRHLVKALCRRVEAVDGSSSAQLVAEVGALAREINSGSARQVEASVAAEADRK